MTLSLRPVVLEDARRVFEWRNDPWIVSFGGSGKTVSWDEHISWFEETVNGRRRMFIILEGDEPIGQVRFERLGEDACEVSIYLLRPYTGRGRGVEALRRGCAEVFASWDVAEVRAYVLHDNRASLSAFQKAGFSLQDGGASAERAGHVALRRRRLSPVVAEGWAEQTRRIGAHYDSLVGRYGHDHRACDYGRRESQLAKFEVLADVMPLTGKRILDVGCGFGDFAEHLAARYGEVRYEGVDLSTRMIEEARRLRPALSLRVLDILREEPGELYDLVTANGIFYLLGEAAEDRMRELVARLFDLCTHALAFNSLSAWSDRPEPGEFRADPLRTLEFCRTLTPSVVLRHDYLPHDFTVYLYREARGR